MARRGEGGSRQPGPGAPAAGKGDPPPRRRGEGLAGEEVVADLGGGGSAPHPGVDGHRGVPEEERAVGGVPAVGRILGGLVGRRGGLAAPDQEIGRASCRERVWISVVVTHLKANI